MTLHKMVVALALSIDLVYHLEHCISTPPRTVGFVPEDVWYCVPIALHIGGVGTGSICQILSYIVCHELNLLMVATFLSAATCMHGTMFPCRLLC